MGVALLAATATHYDTLKDASNNMVVIVKNIYPLADNKGKYDQIYGQFKQILKERGYLG